jgi:hypothetical protein
MIEVHTQPNGVGTGNGQDANGAAWHGRNVVPAECSSQADAATEIPEVFQMPPVPTTRVRARVRNVGPAPFVFVDELSE